MPVVGLVDPIGVNYQLRPSVAACEQSSLEDAIGQHSGMVHTLGLGRGGGFVLQKVRGISLKKCPPLVSNVYLNISSWTRAVALIE